MNLGGPRTQRGRKPSGIPMMGGAMD